ncbi:hypothetical protein C8R45DRAFT_945770 [Mycena sanguinolenta]|nr:hypothetical protein C8R45DRAFT_945770 [Mycena sanguinolenta]
MPFLGLSLALLARLLRHGSLRQSTVRHMLNSGVAARLEVLSAVCGNKQRQIFRCGNLRHFAAAKFALAAANQCLFSGNSTSTAAIFLFSAANGQSEPAAGLQHFQHDKPLQRRQSGGSDNAGDVNTCRLSEDIRMHATLFSRRELPQCCGNMLRQCAVVHMFNLAILGGFQYLSGHSAYLGTGIIIN